MEKPLDKKSKAGFTNKTLGKKEKKQGRA